MVGFSTGAGSQWLASAGSLIIKLWKWFCAIVLNQCLPTNQRRAKTLPVLTWALLTIGQNRQG
jgi:hypothetical protein